MQRHRFAEQWLEFMRATLIDQQDTTAKRLTFYNGGAHMLSALQALYHENYSFSEALDLLYSEMNEFTANEFKEGKS